MRSRSIFALCILLGSAVLVAGSDTHGDGGKEHLPKISEVVPPKYPNLDSQPRKEDTLPAEGQKDPGSGLSPVDVTIYVTGDVNAVATFLTSNGASVQNIGNTYLEASVPVALLGEVSQRPGVIRVEPIAGPHLDADPDAWGFGGGEGIWGDDGLGGPWDDPQRIPNEVPGRADEDAPPIPGKAPQQYANLTSQLDGIAKQVDVGLFSADSLTNSALLYELPSGDDGQAAVDGESGGDALVGVTIYALEDIGGAASFLKANGVAIRHQGKTYLEAYVPVGLLGLASLQPDVIRIEPIVGPWVDQTADPCIVDLGTLVDLSTLGRARVSRSGSWTGECTSENRSARYARYYSFTLTESRVVTIDLTSSDAAPYLYLLNGVGRDGYRITSDDDGVAGRNAQIAIVLRSGNYTIEATTVGRSTGSFTLEINAWIRNVCIEDLGTLSGTQTVSRTGTWARGCDSSWPARYARFYSFTLTQETIVTVDLTSHSPGVDPLLLGIGRRDRGRGAGDNAQIARVLQSGEYTIEATSSSFSAGATGSFTLEINAWIQNVCVVENLGGLSGTQTVSRTGTWAQGCDSPNRAGRFARHYSFTLTQETIVTVDLASTSPGVDPYLYLMRGTGASGTISTATEGAGGNSQIARVLQSGDYTIEATTNGIRSTGSFTLEINAWIQNVCVVENLGTLSGTQTVSRTNTWAQGCDSPNRVGRYARHYSFTLTQDTVVTVDLTSPSSGVDPYLYLMRGAGADGAIIAFNARRVNVLRSGDYTIEATTYAVRSTGSFTLEINTSPLNVCMESVGTLSHSGTRSVFRAGTWVESCDSGNQPGSYAQYYSFTLSETVRVAVSLASSDASPTWTSSTDRTGTTV